MSATPMRTTRLWPTREELIPWTDKRGRVDRLRTTVFTLLLLPALWLLLRWALHWLGPEPVNAAIHSTGYWTIWLLVTSLAITPLKALAGQPNIVVIRRMTGNAALVYALLHLTLYATDQNWRLLTVVSEILKRFYLTIGFVALLGLLVLGVTSTDGWVRFLGKAWKRLHKLIYGLVVLGLVHYLLQSKLDVSQALLACGAFSWLMLWRVLPAGRDREWPALAGISVAAAVLTLGYEYAWYRFGTHVNPLKVVLGEFNIDFGLHPAGQVLLLGALATAASELRLLSMSAFGPTVLFTMLVFSLGSLVDDMFALFNGWSYDGLIPDWANQGVFDVLWFVLLGLMGIARWRMRRHWQRWLLDALWAWCILYQVLLVATGSRPLGAAMATTAAVMAAVLASRIWMTSRGAALMLVPLAVFLLYRASTLM
jgi:sulfoxide reductase heme-binding subunit YedZ